MVDLQHPLALLAKRLPWMQLKLVLALYSAVKIVLATLNIYLIDFAIVNRR